MLRLSWLVLLVAVLATGCAWRHGGNEHYLGPVLFRHAGGDGSGAVVTHLRTLGLLAEGGRQWGLALGIADRIAVAPRGSAAPVWTAAGGGPLAAGRWHLSLGYLHGRSVPHPALVVRRLYGAQLAAGPEVTALSIGAIMRAEVMPAEDSLTLLEFDASAPLDARLLVWPAAEVAARGTEILEEVQR